MSSPGAEHVERAATEMGAVLSPSVGRDWQVPAGELSWSCRETAAHMAHDLMAYAAQLNTRPREAYLAQDLVIRPEATPAQVLESVQASAGLLMLALNAADPDVLAWHFGRTDPSGFAVLGINELLVHTWDISRGLGLDWEPPEDLALLVVQRMWAQAPDGPAAQVLLWCTGRIALPGHPRLDDWSPPHPATTRLTDQTW